MSFHHISNSCDLHPTTDFYQHDFLIFIFLDKVNIMNLLLFSPICQPFIIFKHKYVRPQYLSATTTFGQFFATHLITIDDGLKFILLYFLTCITLQMMNTSMHLKNLLLRIICFLEMPINIRCQSKIVILSILRFCYQRCQISQNLVSIVRIFLSVHKQS